MTQLQDSLDAGGIVRHNFRINLLEGSLFISSLAFVSPQIVLPALVVELGGTNVIVGLLGVIVYGAAFLPQIFAARFTETYPWKKPWALTLGLMQRLAVLMLAMVVWALGAGGGTAPIVVFLVVYTMGQVLAGLAAPGWFDFYAKLSPVHLRGRLSGLRNALGSAGAFLFGFVLTLLLSVFSFPANYALALMMGFVLQLASLLLQFLLIEGAPSRTAERKPFFAFFRDLPEVLRTDREFRQFMIASIVLTPGTMPVGFFAAYALRELRVDVSFVGIFTVVMVTGQIIGALVNGFLSDRYGNKVVLVASGAATSCACLGALLAPTGTWFVAVFAFVGITVGYELMARMNIAAEYSPVEKRSTYVGLMNAMLAPFYVSGLLGGVIADTLGFGILFLLGLICSASGTLLMIFRVRDPRFLPARATTE